MRIVYFWHGRVRDFENIEFNLGSPYSFSFDRDSRVLHGEKHDSYIPHFFQVPSINKNINISFNAIIGENGTGKTTILEAIKDMLQDSFSDEYLYILSDDQEFYFYSNVNDITCTGLKARNNGKQTRQVKRIYYSNVFDSRMLVKNYYQNTGSFQDISTNSLVKMKDNFRWYISKELSDQINFCLQFEQSPIREFIKIPADIEVALYNDEKFGENFPNGLPEYVNEISKFTSTLFGDFMSSKLFTKKVGRFRDFYLFFLKQVIRYYFYEINNFIKDKFPNSKSKLGPFYNGYYQTLRTFIREMSDSNSSSSSIHILTDLLHDELTRSNKELFLDSGEFKQCLERIVYEINLLIQLLQEDKITPVFGLSGKTKLASLPVEIVEIFAKWKEYTLGALVWTDLSSGEYSMLSMFSRIYAAKLRMIERSSSLTLILIDEGDLYFHPQWQKSWIKNVLIGLNTIYGDQSNGEIQVILTTHSPFILSDIPNDRILLLLKTQEGQGMKIIKQLDDVPLTWGANIHSLYANSFFLTDGFMGSFAKEKINHLAHDLIHKKSEYIRDNSEEIRKIIELIGEPILKNKLVELYQQKIALLKPETKEIYDEIKALQERIYLLEQKAKSGESQ